MYLLYIKYTYLLEVQGLLKGQGSHSFLAHLLVQEDQGFQGLLVHPWNLFKRKMDTFRNAK